MRQFIVSNPPVLRIPPLPILFVFSKNLFMDSNKLLEHGFNVLPLSFKPLASFHPNLIPLSLFSGLLNILPIFCSMLMISFSRLALTLFSTILSPLLIMNFPCLTLVLFTIFLALMFLAQNPLFSSLNDNIFSMCFLGLVCPIVNLLVLQLTLVPNCRLMVILFLIPIIIAA